MRIGYACINLELKKQDIQSTRTAILKTISLKGAEYIKELATKNVIDLFKIIQHNEELGYRFFRITSNLIPHGENPRIGDILPRDGDNIISIDWIAGHLKQIGDFAKQKGHRLTMHPGQYVQLGSPDEKIVNQSLNDIKLHAKILQKMGLTPENGSVIIIHGGGVYGDKPAALERWSRAYSHLEIWAAQYIAVENDEFSYSVLDLLPLCEQNKIPLCPDFFHHSVKHAHQFDIFDPKVMTRIVNTWYDRGLKPKCHYSEQRPESHRGAHSDCVGEIPRNILYVAKKYNFDIMLEVKHKDQCLLQVLEKQFIKIVDKETKRVEWYLKEEW